MEEPEVPSNVAKDIIQRLSVQDFARQISAISIDILNGENKDISAIIPLVEKAQAAKLNIDTYTPITTDVAELLELSRNNVRWHFNLASLAREVSGIGDGMFMILGARPEVGKTAMEVFLTYGPGGFAEQGANVCMFLNEEPAHRVQLRGYSSYMGMNHIQLANEIETVKQGIIRIKDNVKVFDCVGISIDEIDRIVEINRPNIAIIDNMDKVRIDGEYTRDDQRLKELYVRGRELTKRRRCGTIAISQVSAEGEGRTRLNQSMLENSRTGKAAEADLIMLIGAGGDVLGDTFRNICIVKNKITGFHGEIGCRIVPQLSRYTE